MYYLWNLIKRYINISESPEKIAEFLTLKTCEVEEIKKRVLPDGVVIAKVEKVEKHPNADKLFVTILNTGKNWKYQVITGWENIVNAVWKYVSLALPDTYLPSIDLKIVSRKMRWIESQWMICSKSELGIPEDEDKHWIWILNDDFDDLTDEDVGKSLKEKYPWLENWILDVDNKTITHRADLFWHFWLGRELQSIFSLVDKWKIKYSQLFQIKDKIDNTNIFELFSNSNKSSRWLKVETTWCKSYVLVQLDNVKTKKSDLFVRTLIYDLGLNPKNNWVDFSNIFMFLTGQPIHFFDADKVKWDIVVRNAKDWEEFVDLLWNKHILTSDDIVIADDEKVLALAGIIGWLNSAVDENTKNILVEIANFDPVKLRKTALRLGLRTDAELRFEKWINPLWSLYVLLLFLDELKYFKKTLWDFNIQGLNYYFEFDNETKVLKVDIQDMLDFILWEKGINDFINIAEWILTNLWFDVKKKDSYMDIKVPVWRGPSDINISEDIYEEIARIWGYENIKWKPLISKIEYVPYSIFIKFNQDLEDIFVRDFRFDQIETYPWLDENLINKFGFKIDKNRLIGLINPLAPENKYLRDTLFFSFLDVIWNNFRAKDYIKIFEIGKIWYKGESQNKFDYIENLRNYNLDKIPANYLEETKLWFAVYREKVNNWQEDVLLEGKWYIDALLERLSIKGKLEYKKENIKYKDLFHPKKYGNIYLNKQFIWFVWVLHPIYYDIFKFPEKSQLVYFEIDFNNLLLILTKQKKWVKQVNYDTLSDQIVWKDLSFVVDINDSYEKIIDAVRKNKEIEDVIVFDIYKWENLPQDKKSISLSVKIRGEKLTSEDINNILQKVIKEVEKVGWRLR